MGACIEGICGGGGGGRTGVVKAETRREAKVKVSKIFFGQEVMETAEGQDEHRHRIGNILTRWISRGAARPITDFYKDIAQLGEGAYGTVMKMAAHNEGQDVEGHEHHGVSGIYYAVKQIRWTNVWHSRNRDQAKEEQIRRELKTLIGMDHPNVVKFREWFEDSSKGIFFVMELCEGGTLQDILDDVCTLPNVEDRLEQMDLMKGYFRQLTYALSYIHSRKIVHRDLKPDNVMLQSTDPSSDIKLIDFGLAAEHENEGEGEEWQQGTLPFMAPEIFLANRGEYTSQSDMWALGVMFAWIISSLYMGSQQHPILPKEKGVGFNVEYYDLLCAMRDSEPWNRELFAGCDDSSFRVADALFVFEPEQRATAAQLLDSGWAWLAHDQDAADDLSKMVQKGGMMENIKTWQNLSKFDRTVLSYVADHASENQVRGLANVFRALDTKRNGRLSKEELREGFVKLGVCFPEEEMEALFTVMDTDGTGHIDYNEWLSATITQTTLKSPEAVNTAFQCLDASGTGEINTEDLEQAIGRQEAEKIFKECQSESIDRKSFANVVQKVALRRAQTTLIKPEQAIELVRAREQALAADQEDNEDMPDNEGIGGSSSKTLTKKSVSSSEEEEA